MDPCVKCGREREERAFRNRILPGYCWICSHWVRLIPRIRHANSIRFQNVHYLGFSTYEYSPYSIDADKEWVVNFRDGRTAVFGKLSCQGAIPMAFRSELPDNATSIVEQKKTTHFVPYDSPILGRNGEARAYCGEVVFPQEHSSQPTCEVCMKAATEECPI